MTKQLGKQNCWITKNDMTTFKLESLHWDIKIQQLCNQLPCYLVTIEIAAMLNGNYLVLLLHFSKSATNYGVVRVSKSMITRYSTNCMWCHTQVMS